MSLIYLRGISVTFTPALDKFSAAMKKQNSRASIIRGAKTKKVKSVLLIETEHGFEEIDFSNEPDQIPITEADIPPDIEPEPDFNLSNSLIALRPYWFPNHYLESSELLTGSEEAMVSQQMLYEVLLRNYLSSHPAVKCVDEIKDALNSLSAGPAKILYYAFTPVH